jgi:hypothetical protein
VFRSAAFIKRQYARKSVRGFGPVWTASRPAYRRGCLDSWINCATIPRGEPDRMKDFPHASFPPDTIALMTTAMDSALSRLPHPVTSTHVKSIAETILRSTQEGERDPAALERMALLELMISPRD